MLSKLRVATSMFHQPVGSRDAGTVKENCNVYGQRMNLLTNQSYGYGIRSLHGVYGKRLARSRFRQDADLPGADLQSANFDERSCAKRH